MTKGKFGILLLAAALLCGLCVCVQNRPEKKPKKENTSATTEQNDEKEGEEMLAGGWQVRTQAMDGAEKQADASQTAFREEILRIFETAALPCEILPLQCVAYLGQRGNDYAFLCTEGKKLYTAVVRSDTTGAASMQTITPVELKKYARVENPLTFSPEENNGWELTAAFAIPMEPREEEAILAATADRQNLRYQPVCVLGTQVVAGVNYCVLCRVGREDGAAGLAVLTVYAGVNGQREVLSQTAFIPE